MITQIGESEHGEKKMTTTPEAILLGTVQDAGVPHMGCTCARCTAARRDPALRRYAVALALVDHAARQWWLVDATPDIREQWGLMTQVYPGYVLAGVLLTHAHLGHYTGLLHFGREAWHTQQLPVYSSPRMGDFLRSNAPWSRLVTLGNIALRPLADGEPVALAAGLRVTPRAVPHRAEWSDTLAFIIAGPTRRLFYCPDIDSFEPFPGGLLAFLQQIDLALLDGTFFSADELPGRDLREIPHPLVRDTVALLRGSPCESYFIHLNHSNPLLDDGPERAWLRARGFDAADRGARWAL